jgi:1,4-dihydroxy-2-naphthoyl-CoA hydrolase
MARAVGGAIGRDVTDVDREQTEAMRATVPFAAAIGVEVITNRPDEVRARVAWRPERCTTAGVLHGGVIMSLADTTGATCAFQNLPDDAAGTTTIESKTNFLRAVRDGYAEAVSRPLHTGRTVVVVETDVTDASGRPVAKVLQTQAVLRT